MNSKISTIPFRLVTITIVESYRIQNYYIMILILPSLKDKIKIFYSIKSYLFIIEINANFREKIYPMNRLSVWKLWYDLIFLIKTIYKGNGWDIDLSKILKIVLMFIVKENLLKLWMINLKPPMSRTNGLMRLIRYIYISY